jgi:hypothetical protein
MQGCGGRRRIAVLGVLLLCSNTVSSASRKLFKSQGTGRVDARARSEFSSSDRPESGHPWQTCRVGRITALEFGVVFDANAGVAKRTKYV